MTRDRHDRTEYPPPAGNSEVPGLDRFGPVSRNVECNGEIWPSIYYPPIAGIEKVGGSQKLRQARRP